MTFTGKHTRSDRPVVAEYTCPVHGRFTLEVARDSEGNPPDRVSCVKRAGEGGRFRRRDGLCGESSPFAMSAPSVRIRKVEVARGSYQRAEVPTWTDTTNLGEGQDLDDWHADRDKVWEAERERQVMELTREL